ncbi:MAG: DUF5522 domain-containing protein [Flavobacteriales bacterium]|nr:DUF5522 domain-containing protein [Flavobacteriales bacterium]
MTDENFSSKPALDPDDFYLSEEGYIIFTEKYHIKRGYCCMSGCRHCPYGFDKKTGKASPRPSPKERE